MEAQDPKYKKEQERRKKFFEGRIVFCNGFLNVGLVFLCIITLPEIIHYATMTNRTAKETRLFIDVCTLFLIFVFLLLLNNFLGEKLLQRLIDFATRKQRKTDQFNEGRVKELNSALHMLSQCTGVVAWDTIWGVVFGSFLLMFVAFFETCNKGRVLGCIGVSFLFLVGGHIIGKKIWKRHRFDERLIKYTKRHFAFGDEEEYKNSIEQSIQRGILCYTRQWILTDEYMIGRLSDVTFDPIAFPRACVQRITFFYEIRTGRYGGLPAGILKCRLDNGQDVELVIGRGKAVNPVLTSLNQYGISWREGENRYT